MSFPSLGKRAVPLLAAAAIGISLMALVVAWRASPEPWRALAESRGVEVQFRVYQLTEVQGQFQKLVKSAVQSEHARFSDALRLLTNLHTAVTMEEGEERATALEEATEQALARIEEWTK